MNEERINFPLDLRVGYGDFERNIVHLSSANDASISPFHENEKLWVLFPTKQ